MVISRFGIWAAVLACVLMISFPIHAAEDATLTQALELEKAGNFQAAYDLLEPLESERAGDIDYDYLFGVAGVESGNVTRGLFALERVLAIKPNHTAARAAIAKAHYRLGEVDTSKAEFQHVLDTQPDAELSSAIRKYMSAIDKDLGLTTTFGAYMDFGFGHDSNINSGTSSSVINASIAPGGPLVPFTLGAGSREQSSRFLNFAGGVSFRQPFAERFAAFGAINFSKRMNWVGSEFDTDSLDGVLGITYKKFVDSYSIALQASSFEVDAQTFRQSVGLTGQWQRDIDERNQISLYVQGNEYTYPDNNIRDSKRYIVGGGWGHLFAGDKAPFLFLGAYGGQENTDDSTFDFLSNDVYGVRAGGQFTASYKMVAYASAAYERRDYDKQDPSFGTAREDDQYNFSVGLKYLPGYQWTIRPELSYLKNDSNITLFEFDRTVLSINFRKDFNW